MPWNVCALTISTTIIFIPRVINEAFDSVAAITTTLHTDFIISKSKIIFCRMSTRQLKTVKHFYTKNFFASFAYHVCL